jgi:WD40 repeat protein
MLKKIFIMLTVFATVSCAAEGRQSVPDYMKPHIMVVSVSSDGNYAITTDLYKHAVLWNLKAHTYKIIAKDANVYSAYFIKHTDDYMYQGDANNVVIVKNVKGKIIKQFNPGFATYGEVMTSNLQTYIAADQEFNVYKIHNSQKTQIFVSACRNGMTGALYHGPIAHSCTGFEASEKLLNLTLSPNDKKLVGSDGLGGLFIWKLNSDEKALVIGKNQGQTFATISPDGQYVVSGDDDGNIYVFSTKTGKFLKAIEEFDYLVVTLKFITPHILMAFFYGQPPYVTLYSFPSGKKLKDATLVTPSQSNNDDGTSPEVQSYLRDQATDTSPSAHVLVMAMSEKNGILVYHYAPKTQTLKQVWAPVIAPTHWWHFW